MSANAAILVVDDDPEVAYTTSRALSRAGYLVSTAASATEAERLCRSLRPDLVLLDVVLPDGDGVALARRLKDDPTLEGTFLVLLSGLRTRSEEQANGLRRGHADGYIVRPIGRTELLARVEAFLRLRAAQEALRASERSVRARLEALLFPEADVSALSLSDILDTGQLQLLLEDFRSLTGIGAALLDVSGRMVASSSAENLCRRSHASRENAAELSPDGGVLPCERVEACPLGSRACRLGLRNVEAPVVVAGRRLGTLFIGPFLFDDDPRDAFCGEGNPGGVAGEGRLPALAEVSRFSRERIHGASDFLVRLAGMLSTLSHSEVVLSRTVAERDRLVTELKAREAEIRELNADLEARVAARTAELHASNAELQSFSYTVAHDLTAPLRGISGHAGALLEDGEHRLDPESRRRLGRIAEAAHRGGRLIEALLRLAALSRAVVVRGPVDLSAMAASIAADLEEEDPDRRVMWALTPGLTANADGLLVREVLENLIRNAWKFTGEGPGNRIELGASRKGGETIFHVRDDGAGFDMAHSSSLFRVFHRAHPPDSFPGLGIGLALVEKIVRRHEGWVRASGLPGGGATFSFTLEPPAGPGPAGDSRAPAA